MKKKAKVYYIVMLILLMAELIMLPLGIILFYWFMLVPIYGFSYLHLIPLGVEVVILAFLGWLMIGTDILKLFTILLEEKLKEMEKDNGQEDCKK